MDGCTVAEETEGIAKGSWGVVEGGWGFRGKPVLAVERPGNTEAEARNPDAGVVPGALG